MKLIPLLLCTLLTFPIYAQNLQKDSIDRRSELLIISSDQTISSDSSGIRILRSTEDKHKSVSVSELFIMGKNGYRKGNQSPFGGNAPFKGHWSGFHYGFVNFTHLPEAWESLELDWSHSFVMQFNLCKYSINLVPRNNFGLVTGLGLEYQRLRFNNDNISIAKRDGRLEIIEPMEEYRGMETIRRSSFKVLYLTVPLVMEVQFPADNRNRMYISGGFMGGLRMHSKTKIVYEDGQGDKGKKKARGNFNMVPFKADVIGRIGYRNVSIWGSYTLTNMFKSTNIPESHVYTVGFGLTY